MTGHGGGGVQCGKVEHVSILAYLGQKELWDKKGFSALLVTVLREKKTVMLTVWICTSNSEWGINSYFW